MKTEAELAAVANLNLIEGHRKLVERSPDGAIHEHGGVFAFATGVPIALFNGCIVTEPVPSADLEAGLDWIRRRGSPYLVWIDERNAPGLGDAAIAYGLVREPAIPGMVLHPIPDPPAPPAAVTVVEVNGAGLAEHIGALVEGGMPAEVPKRLFTPRIRGRSRRAAVHCSTGRAAGGNLGGYQDRGRGRRLCRPDAGRRPPPGGRNGAVLGRRGGGLGVGLRHRRAPID